MAGCFPLLLQLLHLLSTCISLPHLLSLNQSFSCFFDLFPLFHPRSTLFTFSIHFMYHCLHQNIFLWSSQNMIIPPHAIFSTLPAASFNPNMSISSSLFLLSTNFTPHIALTIDLSVLLEIATSCSPKHHVSLPYNIVNLAIFGYFLTILEFWFHPLRSRSAPPFLGTSGVNPPPPHKTARLTLLQQILKLNFLNSCCHLDNFRSTQ